MIDNYDSFTFNLVQYIEELGQDVTTVRNDSVGIAEIEKMNPERIVISPGPCTPKEAGISVEVIRAFSSRLPILGVCLGHQCIAAAFGGRVLRAERIMHGKTSPIHHDGGTVFRGLANPFIATRYHSLLVEEESLPKCLQVSARTAEGEVMGLRHKSHPTEGVQFHPESILTESGKELVKNFLSL